MADITGTWLGTYWQQDTPTRFEATLVQGGHVVSGNVLDDNWLGEAFIHGDVAGRMIQFTKRYVASSPTPIAYQGEIAADAQSMRGTWQIDSGDAGQWEAYRSGENLVASLETGQTQELSFARTKG